MAIRDVLTPQLSKELVIKFYDRLCNAEIRKIIGWKPEMQEGIQTGYIFCITDFFGETSEKESVDAYNRGETYLHILNLIVGRYFVDFIIELTEKQEKGDLEFEDLDRINTVVSASVKDFVENNFEKAFKAINFL